MPTPLSFVLDEFQVLVKQEIEKIHPELVAHLPHPRLAELVECYAVDTEEFWKQKHVSYFYTRFRSF